MASVLRLRSPEQWKARTWAGVFGLLALGAALGAIVHAFTWTTALRSRLWGPIYFCLAFTVALFVSGAIYDVRGYSASRKSLPAFLAIALAFFASTQLGNANFLWFVAYELVATLLALGVYTYLAVGRRAPGALLMTLGISLTILAAVIQATKTLHWEGPVPVNSDGIFHLVQIVAVVVLVGGLRRGLISPVEVISRVRAI